MVQTKRSRRDERNYISEKKLQPAKATTILFAKIIGRVYVVLFANYRQQNEQMKICKAIIFSNSNRLVY